MFAFIFGLLFNAVCCFGYTGFAISNVSTIANVALIKCNWSSSPLEIELSADPGKSNFTILSFYVNGTNCNQGYNFMLDVEGEIAPWVSITNRSFYLGYNESKNVSLNIFIPNNVTIRLYRGNLSINDSYNITKIPMQINVTDNVGNISIRVYSDGVPLVNASIHIFNATGHEIANGTTNLSGIWQSYWLPIGNYIAEISKTGYTTARQSFNITKLNTTILEISLAKVTVGRKPREGIFIPQNCLNVDRSIIEIKIRKGDSRKETIKIKNGCNKTIEVEINVSNIEKFFDFSVGEIKSTKAKFVLQADEELTLFLNFRIQEEEKVDIYTGQICIKSQYQIISIPVIIAVLEKELPFFDVVIEIPSFYKEIFPGEEVVAGITLYNFDGVKKDYIVDIYIKNMKDEVIAHKQKVLSVETELYFTESFSLPADLPYGSYIFYVKTSYQNRTAVSSALFYLVEPKIFGIPKNFFLIFITAIAIALAIIIILLTRTKKLESRIKKGVLIKRSKSR